MPQSYSSLWVHLVWSTKNREHILVPELKHEVFKVINDITSDINQSVTKINDTTKNSKSLSKIISKIGVCYFNI